VQQRKRWSVPHVNCELQLLHLLKSFLKSLGAGDEFKKQVLTKPQVAAILTMGFIHEAFSKIWEAPSSSVGRHKERSDVKIHPFISRTLCN